MRQIRGLPDQLQGELELARVEGRGRLAGLVPVVVDVRDVVSVRDVEDVHDAVELDALGEVQATRYAKIVEDCIRTVSRVARQGPVAEVGVVEARRLQEAGRGILRSDRRGDGARSNIVCGNGIGTIVGAAAVEIGIAAGQDWERTAGCNIDDGGEGPVAEQLARPAIADAAGLIHAAENEAM